MIEFKEQFDTNKNLPTSVTGSTRPRRRLLDRAYRERLTFLYTETVLTQVEIVDVLNREFDGCSLRLPQLKKELKNLGLRRNKPATRISPRKKRTKKSDGNKDTPTKRQKTEHKPQPAVSSDDKVPPGGDSKPEPVEHGVLLSFSPAPGETVPPQAPDETSLPRDLDAKSDVVDPASLLVIVPVVEDPIGLKDPPSRSDAEPPSGGTKPVPTVDLSPLVIVNTTVDDFTRELLLSESSRRQSWGAESDVSDPGEVTTDSGTKTPSLLESPPLSPTTPTEPVDMPSPIRCGDDSDLLDFVYSLFPDLMISEAVPEATVKTPQ